MPERIHLDHSILYLMNRITARLNRTLHESLLKRGLTFQHWRVLSVLLAYREPTIADISEYAVIPHSTLSRLLSRMEREGLITRTMSPDDERAVKVAVRPRGRAVFKQIRPVAIAIRQDALSNFSPDDVKALRRLLQRMYGNIAR